MDLEDKKVLILGGSGLVGSAVCERLRSERVGGMIAPTSGVLDLVDQKQTNDFFTANAVDVVIVAAARVGGILANDTYRAEFLYQNLMIAANVINAAHEARVKKLIFLGSSCIYPKAASQPMREEDLLTGELEATNEPYAIAKIAGLKLCENYYRQYGDNFFSLMPTNLYGPNDNFDAETSHVIPGLINKIHAAKVKGESKVTIWGTGRPLREFMHVSDLANAIVFAIERIEAGDIYDSGISHLNVGTGKEVSISELSIMISDIAGFNGEIVYDTSKPDGTHRKLMDSSRINSLGWKPDVELRAGLEEVYKLYTLKDNKILRTSSRKY